MITNCINTFISKVTEQEIELGLIKENEVELKCAAFFRQIDNIKNQNIQSSVLKSFIEEKNEDDLMLEKYKSQSGTENARIE